MELNKFNLQFFAEEEPTEDSTQTTEEGIDIPEETPEQQAMKQTMEQLESDLSEAEGKIAQFEGTIGSLTEAVKGIMSILGLATESQSSGGEEQGSAELQATVEGLQASLKAVTEERDLLLSQVSEFKAASLKAMTERIVDLKVGLGDIAEEERQDEINRLAEKSEDTLLFVLEEMERRAEKSSAPPVSSQIPKVSNPGMVENKEEAVLEVNSETEEEKELTTEEQLKNISPTDIYKGLLTGKRF